MGLFSKKPKQQKANVFKIESFIAITLTAFFLSYFPSVSSAKVVPGGECKKAGLQQIYKKKVYKCIKLGKKLYWNNGKPISTSVSPSPSPTVSKSPTASPSPSPTVSKSPTASPSPISTSASESFSFIYKHTLKNGGGDDDELTRVSIDSSNRVISKQIVTRAGYQVYHDYLNGTLLLTASSQRKVFLIRDNNDQLSLKINWSNEVAGDKRDLKNYAMKFNASTDELIFWDSQDDIYLLKNLTGNTVEWTKVVSGVSLKTKMVESGFEFQNSVFEKYLPLTGPVVLSPNKLLFATYFAAKELNQLWTLEFSGLGDFSIKKVLTFDAQRGFDELTISPDRKLVAYSYEASALTPNYRIALINTSTFAYSILDTSRHYDGFIGPIAFIGNHNLLMIPAMIWNSDPDGGRIICRIDLRLSSSCSDIRGISGLDVIGTG